MLDKSLFYGGIVGMAYLSVIMWWLTGHTPADLINAVVNVVTQPLNDLNTILR